MSNTLTSEARRPLEAWLNRLGTWWQDEWWREEEYVSAYKQRVNPEDVSAKLRRVAAVFNSDWAKSQGSQHPLSPSLSIFRGLCPLELLYNLGTDLISVEGVKRLRTVEKALQTSSHYDSARLQLAVGARLTRAGYLIEFESPVPNGRRADLNASRGSEQIYLEIKCLSEPAGEWLRSQLTQVVLNSVLDLLRGLGRDIKPFEIGISPEVLDLLGADPEIDAAVIERTSNEIVQVISHQLSSSYSFECEVPSVANIRFVDDIERPGVSSPITSGASELKRIIRKHVQDAIEQLHPEYPGVIVLQSGVPVDANLAQLFVGQMLQNRGSGAAHVAGLLFLRPRLSVLGSPAFFVPNGAARFRAHELTALQHITGD